MNPEEAYSRREQRELPPFSRQIAGVSEEAIELMSKNVKLKIAIESAGHPWADEDACIRLSEAFSDYEPYEIAAFAKRLELEPKLH